METALILGLTSGGACLATCGPLVAAFLAAEQITLKRSSCAPYGLSLRKAPRVMSVGLLCPGSWGMAIFQNASGHDLFAAADLVLGGWLIYYGISRPLGLPMDLPRLNLETLASRTTPSGFLSQRDLGDS